MQETGYRLLREQGIELIAAESPASFIDDTPTAALIRQVAQFEKAGLVAKLRGTRERIRREYGKCEGRKSRVERLDPAEAQKLAEAVVMARRLRPASLKNGER